ncbi:MAG: hypothetical protein M0P22_08795, partial [Methanoculleus sp.]|nr:hypothetical protein [Methanoculleus sp.]
GAGESLRRVLLAAGPGVEWAGGGAVSDCRNGSVQVMLFADRLKVWNPGTLPPSLTLKNRATGTRSTA